MVKLVNILKKTWKGAKIASMPVKHILTSLDDILEGFVSTIKERPIINLMKCAAGIVSFSPLYLYLHESLHGAVSKINGGVNYGLYMTESFGGKLINKILPWVNHEPLKIVPYANEKYVEGSLGMSFSYHHENTSMLANVAMFLSPYLLTIPGFFMIKKGIKERKPFWTAAGTTFILPTLNNGILSALNKKGDVFNSIYYNVLKDMPEDYVTNASIIGAILLTSGILYASKKIAEKVDIEKLKFKTMLSLGLIAGITALAMPKETFYERRERFDERLEELTQTASELDYKKYETELEKVCAEFFDKKILEWNREGKFVKSNLVFANQLIKLVNERRDSGQKIDEELSNLAPESEWEIALYNLTKQGQTSFWIIENVLSKQKAHDFVVKWSKEDSYGLTFARCNYILKTFPDSPYFSEAKEEYKIKVKEWYEGSNEVNRTSIKNEYQRNAYGLPDKVNQEIMNEIFTPN